MCSTGWLWTQIVILPGPTWWVPFRLAGVPGRRATFDLATLSIDGSVLDGLFVLRTQGVQVGDHSRA
jgi:hypothetical protein